jgi:hypothetical protein
MIQAIHVTKTNICQMISTKFYNFFQTLGMEQRFDYATPLTAFGQVSLLQKRLQYIINNL